jgi:hypothetical protein
MKKLISVVSFLALTCISPRYAFSDVYGNPDRVPSIGLNYWGIRDKGEVKYFSTTPDSQHVRNWQPSAILDIRVPCTGWFTFNAGIGYYKSDRRLAETPTLIDVRTKTSGTIFNVGFRFYLQ